MRSSTRVRGGPVSAIALLSVALVACRKGSESNIAAFIPITPSFRAAAGCNGPDQSFMPTLVYADASIGPMSQIAAPIDPLVGVVLDTIYLTGGDGSVRALDFSGGTPPVETIHVTPGHIDTVLAAVGIVQPAVLSGVAALDAANLLVIEHTSHTVLLVDLLVQDNVTFFSGFPSTAPGLADGAGGSVRYGFSESTMLIPTGEGVIFVADSGNNALRRITPAVIPFTETIAGTGAPGHFDGLLFNTTFDTPVGLSISCGGEVLVTDSGSLGQGGHRLRTVAVGNATFFGSGFEGSSRSLAGDGVDATTEGTGTGAQLAAPRGLASTSTGEVFWVDSTTGLLRRYSVLTDISDCPGFMDCATAVMMPTYTPGGGFSVAISEAGILYVLDADAGELYRVTL